MCSLAKDYCIHVLWLGPIHPAWGTKPEARKCCRCPWSRDDIKATAKSLRKSIQSWCIRFKSAWTLTEMQHLWSMQWLESSGSLCRLWYWQTWLGNLSHFDERWCMQNGTRFCLPQPTGRCPENDKTEWPEGPDESIYLCAISPLKTERFFCRECWYSRFRL